MKNISLFIRLITYAALLVGVYAVIAYDAAQGLYHETSFTEIAQELLLLLIIIISFVTAQQHRPYRTFNRLLGVVALLSLIREFNNFLGAHLFDRAWQVGVLLVLLGASPYFVRRIRSLVQEWQAIAGSYAFGILLTGGLVLHVFSRFYGLPGIWQNVMGEAYLLKVTRVSEESIELLAYSIIFVGVTELILLTLMKSKATRKLSNRMPPRASYMSKV